MTVEREHEKANNDHQGDHGHHKQEDLGKLIGWAKPPELPPGPALLLRGLPHGREVQVATVVVEA